MLSYCLMGTMLNRIGSRHSSGIVLPVFLVNAPSAFFYFVILSGISVIFVHLSTSNEGGHLVEHEALADWVVSEAELSPCFGSISLLTFHESKRAILSV